MKMMIFYSYVFYLLIGSVICNGHVGFDDSVLFKINWPGELSPEHLQPDEELIQVTSPNNEKYECRIPSLTPKNPIKSGSYSGPTPIQLLNPLFSQKVCSYRIESYWSYELCHGRYVRQYHEEREGKKVKVQEYFLGRWSREKQLELEIEMAVVALNNEEKLKYKKIDGIKLPYVELEMTDGTICDLNGKPRLTRVLYVCYALGKHEVYSFKETWTCEYEVIVLSPILCSHPKYKPAESGENAINCLPLGSSPKKPRSLLALEAESLKLRHQKISDGDPRVKIEIHPLDLQGDQVEDKSSQFKLTTGTPPPIEDTSPVRAFLDGDNCLNGGSGWWKYEFCYGKSVEQYHIDRSGTRQSLLLGKFYESDHIAWITEFPHKKPKPKGQQRTQISHFYSRGSICDKTGAPRQTEVKLKCLENSSSPGQVSLYLLEPKTCEYILGVESPLICDILHLANDNGLIKPQIKPQLQVTAINSSSDEQEKIDKDENDKEEKRTGEMHKEEMPDRDKEKKGKEKHKEETPDKDVESIEMDATLADD